MPRVSDHEEFLKATMLSNNDVIVILDEGIYKSPEETGLDREVFHIKMGLPDQCTKIWNMNRTTQRTLAARATIIMAERMGVDLEKIGLKV